ncbi:hypothetical protein CCP2SC5_2200004 [Azospirillaceae bacterium]
MAARTAPGAISIATRDERSPRRAGVLGDLDALGVLGVLVAFTDSVGSDAAGVIFPPLRWRVFLRRFPCDRS